MSTTLGNGSTPSSSQPLRLLSVEEVCERLRVGESTVRAAIREQRLCVVRLGRRVLVSETALIEFVQSLTTKGAPP